MNSRPLHAACGPPRCSSTPKIQARNSRNVTWMRIAVPATDPMFRDQDMTTSWRLLATPWQPLGARA